MIFKNWTISSKFYAFSGLLLSCLIAVGVVAQLNSKRIIEILAEISELHLPATRHMDVADMKHDGIRANALQAIVISQKASPVEWKALKSEQDEMMRDFLTHLSELQKLPLPSQDQEKLRSIQEKAKLYIDEAVVLVSLASEGKAAEASQEIPRFQETFEALAVDMEALGEDIAKNTTRSVERSGAVRERAEWINLILILASVLVGAMISLVFTKSLTKAIRGMVHRIETSTKEVSEMSSKLSESAASLSQSTKQQDDAVTETSAAVEEITVMAAKTSESSHTLQSKAQEGERVASLGSHATTQMKDAMIAIAASYQKLLVQVEMNNKQFEEISRVIASIDAKTRVINDIAFQTKILSFNASVESARAGEHGKGFAVVAEEVGKLAATSGSASNEISQLLLASLDQVKKIVGESRTSMEILAEKSQADIRMGQDLAQKCGVLLGDMVNFSRSLSGITGEISTASREQSIGLQNIAAAMGRIEKSNKDNANTSRACSGFSETLSEKSDDLTEVLVAMQKMTG